MFDGIRRFFSENGDPETLRFYGAGAAVALVVLPLLGVLKGNFSGAMAGALVLEVALGVLYVLFCVSNRQFDGHRAAKLHAARMEGAAQGLGASSADSRYHFSTR